MFEDALAGVAAGRAGRFGFVVGVDRTGQADALREHGADIVVSDLAELLEDRDDHAVRLRRRALVGARDAARSRDARADGVGVRARQRAHRAAREPGRRRAVRPARHLSELVLRAAPAALRGERLRLPRVGPDDRQRHQRQDHPPARRRRALRHPLRAAPVARARARPPRRRPSPPRRVEVAGRRCRSRRARRGSSRSSNARRQRSSTRSSRSTNRFAWSSSRSWSRTSRVPAAERPTRCRRAGGAASIREPSSTATRVSCWFTPATAASC